MISSAATRENWICRSSLDSRVKDAQRTSIFHLSDRFRRALRHLRSHGYCKFYESLKTATSAPQLLGPAASVSAEVYHQREGNHEAGFYAGLEVLPDEPITALHSEDAARWKRIKLTNCHPLRWLH